MSALWSRETPKSFADLCNLFDDIRHSLRLNAEVVARAGFFVVGVNMILQVVILFLYVHCKNHTKKMEKMSKINPVVALH